MKRKLGPRGRVVIPKEIRDRLNLEEGTTLTFEIRSRTILVRPEPMPQEVVRRFLSVRCRKRRKRVDWKSVLAEEYKAKGR